MSGLKIRQLSASDETGREVARNVDFDLPDGARKALIGPNGAGKTGFADLIAGLNRPESGAIHFNDRDITRQSAAWRAQNGIVKSFQATGLFKGLSLRETLRLPNLRQAGKTFSMLRSAAQFPQIEASIEALLDRLNLSAVADLPVDELTPSQQRLGDLAVALSQRPRLLIVDEPLAGLPSRDHPLIAAVLAALPRELSILIIEHHLDLAPRFAHSVAVYVNGVILAEGTSDEIRNDRDVGALFRGGSL